MATNIEVPTLGESVTEATVGEWLKQPGDSVAVDEPIVSLETDKVAVEVPSPVAGVLGEHQVSVGDTVEVGSVIATVEEGSGGGAAKPKDATKDEGSQPAEKSADLEKAAPEQAKQVSDNDNSQTLSPAVRRAVLEHGLDPSTIDGTGKDGRLTKEDVLRAAQAKKDDGGAEKSAPAPAPSASPAGSGERKVERVKMTRMRQTIAKRLKGAQDNAALLTTFNDCDMSAVMEAREKYKDLFAKKHDIKLGFMGFFVTVHSTRRI